MNFLLLLFLIGLGTRLSRWVRGDGHRHAGTSRVRPGVRLPADGVPSPHERSELPIDPDPILGLIEKAPR